MRVLSRIHGLSKKRKDSLRHIGMNRKEEGRERRASVGQMKKKEGEQ